MVCSRRCPVQRGVISKFKYDEKLGVADAVLYSMFRFQDSKEVHFQCDIAVCKGNTKHPVIHLHALDMVIRVCITKMWLCARCNCCTILRK